MDGSPPPQAAAGQATRTEAPADEIRQIEREFPGWGAWRSDANRWWAFRTSARPLTIEQIRAGCRLIVQADTAEELRTAIRGEIACTDRA